jgi:hypothetical protein
MPLGSAYLKQFGVWRSPVARLLWEQEVPGSNPGAPMNIQYLCVPPAGHLTDSASGSHPA